MGNAFEVIPASGGYLALIAAFPLRPIRSDEELEAATRFLEGLARRDDLDDDEEGYLSVLVDLIKLYEVEHHAPVRPEPAEMLRYLLESRGVSQVELSRATGIGVSAISEILNRKRRVAMSHVDKLATFFDVGPALFVERGAGD
ncbi:helix-turn-helix domain-containing protein [Singulisphaera sp. PoT]|uniref:helix-turn-helix domain-containing protein n=1 Tax=Singulisphaera sp. PoT TaxID=3411797 RepID=UPI003BF4CD7B